MAKSKRSPNKRGRRALAEKRAKRTKILIITTLSVIVIAIAAYLIVNAFLESGTEVYSDGLQSVRLRQNGSFSAELAHSTNFNGTFTYSEQGESTIVSFTYDGTTVDGEIVDGQLTIPDEWRDLCGHNPVLPKR